MIPNRMFNFTPPIRQNVVYLISLLSTCTLLSACTCCSKKSDTGDAPRPVQVSKAIFHNPDSLLAYAERAYLHDDPDGLYVTGAAAYLRANDPNYPDSCTTVPLLEASVMLKRAAELGHADAAKLILCLQESNCWVEEPLNDKGEGEK